MPSSANIVLGPGTIYVAPLGTAEPTDASTALPGAWRAIGYTEDGSEFTYELSTEAIEVEEEFDAVRWATVGRNAMFAFSMAEATKQNLALALNAGANVANDATAFEPPDPGTEVRIMIIHQTQDGARWLFRQCLQSDAIAISRKKAPDKALIPATFRLEKPPTAKPFKVFPSPTGTIGLI